MTYELTKQKLINRTIDDFEIEQEQLPKQNELNLLKM